MEKPIIFSPDMVRAILDDRKTQTRRVLKAKHGSPYGSPGDLLYVREKFAINIPGCEEQNGISYAADHINPKGDGPANPIKWKPSIHMPKEAARIWLKIKKIKTEKLQDISENDAIVEGCPLIAWDAMQEQEVSPSDWFRCLWDSINGKPRTSSADISWKANPTVWVVEFEKYDRKRELCR